MAVVIDGLRAGVDDCYHPPLAPSALHLSIKRKTPMSVLEAPAKTFAPRPFLATARNFGAGGDTPRAYLERCLAAISEHEPAVGAFVELNLDGVRKAAD